MLPATQPMCVVPPPVPCSWLRETTGDISVAPYPSRGRMSNFASMLSASDGLSFSAPEMTSRSGARSSRSARRR